MTVTVTVVHQPIVICPQEYSIIVLLFNITVILSPMFTSDRIDFDPHFNIDYQSQSMPEVYDSVQINI